ncbi:MAG: flippase [Candidatus Beckwithbacteria bacterium]|nr:flippase [Candidatus Beckwithbacteria bacterium]
MKIKLWLFNNLTTKQTVVKNTFWLMLAEVVSKAPVFFLNIWIIRYLGAEDYGRLSFVFAFGSLLVIFTDLGLSTLTIREVAKNKSLARKYIDNLIVIKLILSLAVLGLVFLSVKFLGKFSELITLVFWVTIFVTITSLTTFFQAIFQAFEKMEFLVVSKIVYSLSLVLIVFYVVQQQLGIEGLTKGYVVAAVIALLATMILTKKKLVEFWPGTDLTFFQKSLREAWPFALIILLGSIYMQMNTIQLKLLAGDIEVGLYNIAFQLIFVMTVLGGVFFSALFPSLAKEYGKSKIGFYKLIDFFTKWVISGVLIFCLILFLISGKLFVLLYGPDYVRSISMFRLLLIAFFILFINTTYSEALKTMNLQKDYLKALFWGSLLNFLLNFVLIAWWGGVGASLTAILSSSLITILIITKFRKLKQRDLAK